MIECTLVTSPVVCFGHGAPFVGPPRSQRKQALSPTNAPLAPTGCVCGVCVVLWVHARKFV